jgi:hypothetical protein
MKEKRGILTECPKCKGRVAYGLRAREPTANEMIDLYEKGIHILAYQTVTETYAWCKNKVNCGWEEPE